MLAFARFCSLYPLRAHTKIRSSKRDLLHARDENVYEFYVCALRCDLKFSVALFDMRFGDAITFHFVQRVI